MSRLSSLVESFTKALAAGRRRTVVLKTRHAFNLAYNPELFAATEAMRLRKASGLRAVVSLKKS